MHEANDIPNNDVNALNEASRRAWETNAAHWDDYIGEATAFTPC